MRELRKTAYQNKQWRSLRDAYMHQHPICEECLKSGKVTPAVDIHHKVSPFKRGNINYELLLDQNNLESVCKECHAEIHNKQRGFVSPEDVIKQLDELFEITE